MAERITQLIRAATGGDRPARGTLTKWAKQVGTSTATVSRWRSGTIPDPGWWPALAHALNVSEEDIRASAEAAPPSAPRAVDSTDPVLRLTKVVNELSDEVDRLALEMEELRARSASPKRSASR